MASSSSLVSQASPSSAFLGGRPLLDFDWRVVHVLGSSALASLGDSLLQLTLVLGPTPEQQGRGERASQRLTVELSPAELSAVLEQLEAAHTAALAVAAR